MKHTPIVQAAQLAAKAAVDSINYASVNAALVSRMIEERAGDCPEAVYYINGLRIDFDRAFKFWRAPTSVVLREMRDTVDPVAYQAAADEYVMYILRSHPFLKKQWKQAISKAAVALQAFILQSNPPNQLFNRLEQLCPGGEGEDMVPRQFAVVENTVDAWTRVYVHAIKKNPDAYMSIMQTLSNDLHAKTPTVNIGGLPTPASVLANEGGDDGDKKLWMALIVAGVGVGVGGLVWWYVKNGNMNSNSNSPYKY